MSGITTVEKSYNKNYFKVASKNLEKNFFVWNFEEKNLEDQEIYRIFLNLSKYLEHTFIIKILMADFIGYFNIDWIRFISLLYLFGVMQFA